MYPFIREGDRCKFVSIADDEMATLRRGVVLLVAADHGRFVAHRLYRSRRGLDGWTFILKGDTNLCFDQDAKCGQIVGKLESIDRGGRVIHVDRLPFLLWGWLVIRTPGLSRMLRKVAK